MTYDLLWPCIFTFPHSTIEPLKILKSRLRKDRKGKVCISFADSTSEDFLASSYNRLVSDPRASTLVFSAHCHQYLCFTPRGVNYLSKTVHRWCPSIIVYHRVGIELAKVWSQVIPLIALSPFMICGPTR